jgi:uncharacterized membrane protein
MDLSPTHIHLLLNHFPTIGFIIGLGVFVAALIAKSDDLKQAGLVIFVGISLLTIPTYVTGNAAAMALEDTPGVSKVLVDMHEGAAFVALMLMVVTGGFAWLGLWQYRRVRMVPLWTTVSVLGMAGLTLLTVSRAANIGGEIMHPEIRVTAEATTEQLARSLGTLIGESPFLWVAFESLHFIGLSLLIGVVLAVHLRTIGVIKHVSYTALDRLLPWAILGFGLNTITGMMFFIAASGQYVENIAFYWKLVFVLLAGANTVYFLYDKGWETPPGADAPTSSKLVAASALVLWLGVLYWGSMLPFIGNAF